MIRKILENWEPKWSDNVFKFVLATIVLGAFFIPVMVAPIPMIEFFNGMAAQPKAKTQMHYGRVFDKEILSLQKPVEGTVPQGVSRYPFGDVSNDIEDAKKVGGVWKNPIPISMESMKIGEERFKVLCATCHGKLGEGDGGVVGPGRFPAPPSLHTDGARAYEDGTIYHIIMKGNGKMPGYADKLEPDERWHVINYLRALQRARNPKSEDIK